MMHILLTILAEVLPYLLALPAVRSAVLLWTSMYTLVVPEEMRTARRAEVRSDLHDQESYMRQEGYPPIAIAFSILARMILGIWDDIRWSAPHLPSTLSNQLSRGSDAVRRARPSPFVLSLLTAIWIMNLSLYAADRAVPLIEWVGMNAMMPVVGWAVFNQENRWARRITRAYTFLMLILVVTLPPLVVLELRLYQNPAFYPTVLRGALAMAPIAVAIGVATRPVRSYLFKGRWWPVLVTWVLLGGACVVAAVTVGGNLAIVLGMTFFAALTPVVYFGLLGIMAVIFGLGAMAICFVARKGTAGCMRLAAVGIRRLERKS